MRTIPILDAVLPRRCVSCGAIVTADPPVCTSCLRRLSPVRGPRCDRCGIPLVSERERCLRCRSREPAFDSHRSVFIYDGVAKDIIAGYKFGRRLALLPLLAQYLAVELGRWGAPSVVPVVPVPASPAGRRRRGFDQVALLSRELARRHAVVVCHALTRRRGREQKRLDVAGRSRNLVGAVRVRPAVLAERPGRVILLDDVFTTGATIHECARVLRSAGVSAVDALTLAAD